MSGTKHSRLSGILILLTCFAFVCFLSPGVALASPAIEPYWPYPRHDLANTSASDPLKWQVLEAPEILWSIQAPEGYDFDSFYPVAADIDGDGRAEYLTGLNHYGDDEYWLYAYNVEDGSVLWQHDVGDWFRWSAPVIVDIDNDGHLDVVLGSDDEVMALRGNDGSSLWTQSLSDGGGMTVADVDGDGLVEVIITDMDEPHRIHLLCGQDGSEIWFREIGGSAYNIPTVADINADGYNEILCHYHLYDPSREKLTVWDKDGHELWSHVGSPSAEQEAQAPPELGYVPDYGYVSTTVADFDADGDLDIGYGTRCHYYLLDTEGEVLWQLPIVQGYGLAINRTSEGTYEPDEHGLGGPSGSAVGVGNLDADPQLEVVISLSPEHRIENGWRIADVTPANAIWAVDGQDGSIEWVFEGDYPSESDTENMREPVLVDLNADGRLDVLARSSNGHVYAVQGDTGEELMAYQISDPTPGGGMYCNPADQLTFVGWGSRGLLLYAADVCVDMACTQTLYALETATRVYDIYLPVIHKD